MLEYSVLIYQYQIAVTLDNIKEQKINNYTICKNLHAVAGIIAIILIILRKDKRNFSWRKVEQFLQLCTHDV